MEKRPDPRFRWEAYETEIYIGACGRFDICMYLSGATYVIWGDNDNYIAIRHPPADSDYSPEFRRDLDGEGRPDPDITDEEWEVILQLLELFTPEHLRVPA